MAEGLLAKNPRLRLSLARNGLILLSLSIAFDYSTSWTMMSLLGASAEGNALVRGFYESRDAGAFIALVESQSLYISVLIAALAAFLIYRKETIKNKVLVVVSPYLAFAVALAWLLGAERITLGPTSNLSAFVTTDYGQQAGSWSYSLMAVGVGIVILTDLLWTYFRATPWRSRRS